MAHKSQVSYHTTHTIMPDTLENTDDDIATVDLALSNDKPMSTSAQPWNDAATLQVISDALGDSGGAQLSSRVWVPASKHPQIDPGEFAQWIKTHGLGTTSGRSSGLRRQRSTLSVSYTSEYSLSDDDDDDDDEVLPISPTDSHASLPFFKTMSLGRQRSLEKDTFGHDDPMPIPPLTRPENRSLLRRQALSARGKDRRRPATKVTSVQPADDRIGSVPDEGVSLYDRPVVSLSEWIDLGSASLETSASAHIFTRAHEAGTQVLSQLADTDSNHAGTPPPILDELELQSSSPQPPPTVSTTPSSTSSFSSSSSTPSLLSFPSVSTLDTKRNKRRSLGRSLSERLASKNDGGSFFGHLFGSDKKRRAASTPRVVNERTSKTGMQVMLSKKASIAGFLSRQFSLRSFAFAGQTRKAGTTTSTLAVRPASQQSQHVGRAVYWLSHNKLTNPRRPLRHQVLISNFMFWYLSALQTSPHHESPAYSAIPLSHASRSPTSPLAVPPIPPVSQRSKKDQDGDKYKPVVNAQYQQKTPPRR